MIGSVDRFSTKVPVERVQIFLLLDRAVPDWFVHLSAPKCNSEAIVPRDVPFVSSENVDTNPESRLTETEVGIFQYYLAMKKRLGIVVWCTNAKRWKHRGQVVWLEYTVSERLK